MGGFQLEVIRFKLDVRLSVVVVTYLVHRLVRRARGSHLLYLVIRCLIVVMYFSGHLLVIIEIKMMQNSR